MPRGVKENSERRMSTSEVCMWKYKVCASAQEVAELLGGLNAQIALEAKITYNHHVGFYVWYRHVPGGL
jgi:hypothetical protein